MGVQDGFPVSAGYTNPRFISKNQNDVMPFILAFSNAGSGTTVSDIQAAVNRLYAATGVSEVATGTVYNATPGTIANGDNYETALSILADKFDSATGHMHTGVAGDGPILPASGMAGFYLLGYLEKGDPIVSATGSSTDITSMFSVKTPSNGSTQIGVPIISPNNTTRLLSSTYQNLTDGSGNLVYGRVTAASGSWSLNYYSHIAGVETAYSFASPQNLFFWYQELFYPNETTPVYLPVNDLFSPSALGVTSLAATGNSGLQGNIILNHDQYITEGQAGQVITIGASASASSSTSNLVARDGSGNSQTNNFIQGYTTTATAGSTTTLSVTSTELQYFTGTLNQTIVLPVVSTLVTGQSFDIVNLSSGTLTINSSGANLVATVTASSRVQVTCISTSGTGAGSWSAIAGGTASPLTTKGDLYGYSTTNARVPVGTNGQKVIADSNATNGVRYQSDIPYKNYIVEADAELGATTGWATFSNSASNIPTSGTGGTATGLTFSASNSSPLSEVYSYLMAQANSTNIQGKGVSYDFSIDSGDQANVLSIRFDFNASSTFVAGNGITPPLNDGTTTTNAGNSDIEVFIYDVTNSKLIYCTPEVITANGSNNFQFFSTFQTAPNSTSYRLIFYVATANANATGWSFKFDNVYVGAQALARGAPITDWNTNLSFTTNGFGTISNSTFESRRVGDSLEVSAIFESGTAAASTAYIQLPSGLTIDTTKLSSNNAGTLLGVGNRLPSTANISSSGYVHFLFYDGSTNNQIFITDSTNSGYVKLNGNSLVASSQFVSYRFLVPIAGWSSSVQMSNDATTRVVAATYAASTTRAPGSNTQFNFDTLIVDTHLAVTTGSSWKFTAPVSGIYQVSIAILPNSSTTGDYYIFKNGSSYKALISPQNGLFGSASAILALIAGDFIDIRSDTASSIAGGGVPYVSSISIFMLTGPSAIAATEKVFLQYTGNAGTSLTANVTNIDWSTKVVDSHNAWNGTSFGAPRAGWYNISCMTVITVSGQIFLSVYVNGSQKLTINQTAASGVVTGGATSIYLNAGDTLSIRSDTNKTLSNSAQSHWVSISSQG
jgi:hypothetical protein